MNLLRIPAKDINAYGRALLDHLFSKQEQKASVVLKTKKSEKPPLSPRRVEKMFGMSLKVLTLPLLCLCPQNAFQYIHCFVSLYIYRLYSPEVWRLI